MEALLEIIADLLSSADDIGEKLKELGHVSPFFPR
jgi:hypothetical protein